VQGLFIFTLCLTNIINPNLQTSYQGARGYVVVLLQKENTRLMRQDPRKYIYIGVHELD
jgi:uncharacterized lipoprotein NlpE involved in copper resistance